ncbi:MAG: hypothetical protein ACK4KT_09665 [Thermaurantimonas sp.]
MDKMWFLIKGIIAVVSIVLGFVIDSSNRGEQTKKITNQESDNDSIAYIISNKKMKTLRVKGDRILILEQDRSIHVHETKK